MALFDFPAASGRTDLASIVGQIAGNAAGYHVTRLQDQNVKRIQRALKPTAQQPGWGGSTPRGWSPSMSLASPPTVYEGPQDMAEAGRDYYDGVGFMLPGPLGKILKGGGAVLDALSRYAPTTWEDPTPGPWAQSDPRSQDAYPVSKSGRPRRGPTHPARTTMIGADGRVYEYKSIGRALLSTLDMSGYRKVCKVAHELLGGPAPKASRRKKSRRRTRTRRAKRCGPTTLSPKQLAAGFGGKRYKR